MQVWEADTLLPQAEVLQYLDPPQIRPLQSEEQGEMLILDQPMEEAGAEVKQRLVVVREPRARIQMSMTEETGAAREEAREEFKPLLELQVVPPLKRVVEEEEEASD